ncbi:MAG: heme o synthase [Gammaproteobacteria bacterium]|nr:heme o synthase [Gammaproteobacteria bacterium]
MTTAIAKAHAQAVCWRSYLTLCKPKVVLLITFTALVGALLSVAGNPPWFALSGAMIGIAMASAAGAAMNHWADRKIDGIMLRTRNRPLPRSELAPPSVLVFALSLTATSMAVLVATTNTLTALLTFISIIGYAVIYTMYLKHATPYNIVWGGVAGATPPILGWTAITGEIHTEALLLFLIIFIWTPPHFWSLAIKRRDEYARAGVPMLPVTHGVAFTKLQIMLYTVMLFLISMIPFIIEMSGLIYLAGALSLGIGFAWHACKLYCHDDDRHAGKTFGYSIFYLSMLFAFLLADHYARIVIRLWF